jgi:hypothetical protein
VKLLVEARLEGLERDQRRRSVEFRQTVENNGHFPEVCPLAGPKTDLVVGPDRGGSNPGTVAGAQVANPNLTVLHPKLRVLPGETIVIEDDIRRGLSPQHDRSLSAERHHRDPTPRKHEQRHRRSLNARPLGKW